MYDILIIGSGSAGLSAAIYANREALSFAVIEKMPFSTGKIAESEWVENYPGFSGINGFELGSKLREHADMLGTEFIYAEVEKIFAEKGYYTLVSGDTMLKTRAIIYAAGAEPKKLCIEGESAFTGRGVSYCAVCDGAFYKGKTVVIIGGGDTALHDAVLLSKIADKVYLVHRRSEFRANKTLQDRVKSAENISIIYNAIPKKIIGSNKVDSVALDVEGGEQILLADGVFVAIGNEPSTDLLRGLAELDKSGYVVADESGVTSSEGIFVAGDVRTKQLRQVVTAASDGANCVYSAEKYLERFN